MMKTMTLNMEILLLAGYIMFSSFLNLIALLISTFYQKKFNQTSPKAGFVIAISLAFLFLVFLFLEKQGQVALQVGSVFTLLGSSIASSLSILNLFLIMRKIRK